jgi:hypothetical protein
LGCIGGLSELDEVIDVDFQEPQEIGLLVGVG